MSQFQQLISSTVWDVKYRYPADQTVEDTWKRVAKAVAKAESPDQRQHWQQAFESILQGFRFLPGGRILAGAGTDRQVTLFNCFVMYLAEDSLDGIFTALKEGALTLQQGGGIGYDFSVLRPRGQLVKKTGTTASGPVSFMRIWDTMSSILLSTGARRGAMMGVLRCDHPDIEEFVAAKADAKELRHFNVSVMVSDAFMQAVKEDADWELVFPIGDDEEVDDDVVYKMWSHQREVVPCRIIKRIKARDLWQKIIYSAYDYAEPGVLFEDTINRLNPLWYREHISATNPCGEIPLPAYGACNLGAINLTQFVKDPFTSNADLDWAAITETTAIATRFLDNVIDVSHYPLRQQKKEALATRRIGLGLTGLADVFVMLGLRYGSADSLALARRIMQLISETTWRTSIELAKEKGAFPAFQSDYLQGEFVQQLPQDIRVALAEYGVRNSHHNTIAPAGTISLLANNVANGLEPIFLPHYDRHMRSHEDEQKTFHVTNYALYLWHSLGNVDTLPPAWTDIRSLSPIDHLHVQGVVQPFIDNAISKTINIPREFPFEQLEEVYSQAHAMGLKGCTVFRPNPTTGSILQSSDDVDHCCQVSG